jgi:hypothetical protein
MKCSDLQLSLGAEPTATSPELETHLRECAACAEYRREMLELDGKIRRALMIDVAELGSATPESVPVQRRPWAGSSHGTAKRPGGAEAAAPAYSRGRQWALAASVLLTVGVIMVMWGALPRHSLAADVVSHVISETIEGPLDGAVSETTVREVMQRSGMRLDPLNSRIVFMRTCLIRGRLVPHFIVRTEQGTATVMIMPDEYLKAPERFDGNGYRGLLIPDGEKGSIAVLSRAEFDSEHYAGEIRRAMHWIPDKQ